MRRRIRAVVPAVFDGPFPANDAVLSQLHEHTMNQAKNPLHGMTLEAILIDLQGRFGWSGLAERIDIRCFKSDPSIKSSLTFLRKTPWARAKVEALFSQVHRSDPAGS